jgi:hypothetical protein
MAQRGMHMGISKGATWAIGGLLVVFAAYMLGVLGGREVRSMDGRGAEPSRTARQQPPHGKADAPRGQDVPAPRTQRAQTPRAEEVAEDRTELVHNAGDVLRSGALEAATADPDEQGGRNFRTTGVIPGQVTNGPEVVQEVEVAARTDPQDVERSGALVGQITEAAQTPDDPARTGVVQ